MAIAVRQWSREMVSNATSKRKGEPDRKDQKVGFKKALKL
jgi:hypothetical protein